MFSCTLLSVSPLRPMANPPNPWASTDVEYLDGEVPSARLEVYEDHTRNILARNDSPDVGFEWSVNPYRGCFHACAYCLSGDTRILMADGTTKELRAVRVGDAIYGTKVEGDYRRLVLTTVIAHWQTVKPAYRVTTRGGVSLVASGDHRLLTRRGWKHVADADQGQRPHLTTNDQLMGLGAFAEHPLESDEYRRGYLCGLVRGDALLKRFEYSGRRRTTDVQHQFRLALVDLEPLLRARAYLRGIGVETREFAFVPARDARKAMTGIRTSARAAFERIQAECAWPDPPAEGWSKGFLAGIFDAEGSFSRGVLRIGNTDERILGETMRALDRLGFDAVLEARPDHASQVRIRGGARESVRFMHTVLPAIARKRSIEGLALKSRSPDSLHVDSVAPMGFDMLMFDITTGTGDFIADGVVAHNCYARPTHEYLELRGRHGLRPEDRRQAARPRPAARGLRQAQVEGRPRRLQRRHRLLPAPRGQLPPHARLPRGVRPVQKPRRRHLEVAAGRARHRRDAGAGPRGRASASW